MTGGWGVGWTVKWKLNRKKRKKLDSNGGVATSEFPSRSTNGEDAPSVWH